jgi:hypothetical protein
MVERRKKEKVHQIHTINRKMRSYSSRIIGFQFFIVVVFVVIGCITSIFSTSPIIVKAFSVGKKYCRGGVRDSGRRSAVTGTFQEMVVEPCESTSSVDGVSKSSHENVKKILSEWFQGDFDNYAQVVEDRKNGLLPREGGGHEHFHCTLVPVTESTRLAAFFFDGNPNRIFRFRYYELLTPTINGNIDNDDDINDDDHQHINNNATVEMRLNTLNPELEQLLKSHATDPLSWPDIFKNFQHEEVSSSSCSSSSSSSSRSDEKNPKVIPLSKCEIAWSFEKDSIQHSYISDTSDGEDDGEDVSLHAIMVHGVQVVNSTIVPGMQIRILDQLSLYQHVFYINDRGFDPITGAFIYGNQRDIPYRLERVSNILPSTISAAASASDQTLQLQVINPELEWTLGPNHRTIEEYDSKLKVIGGPSTGIKMNYKSGQGGKS